MRQVNNFKDVQSALNELFSFKDKFTTKDWDNSGLRITNAGAGVNPNDYATMAQLPTIPATATSPAINYTIVFESPSNVVVGASISPPYVVGNGRAGMPTQVWLWGTQLPTTGPLSINVNVNGNPLLVNNLTLNVGDSAPAVSSIFNTPLKKLGLLDVVTPLVASAGGAGLISIGIVVVVSN